MLSDGEETEQVIKVSNLVAKFENEIKKQTPNQRLIRSVRQALRDSRKNHPLQRQDSAENQDFIISTRANCKADIYKDLSVCTDHPRVITRVQQHNRFTQIKEKCSEIITKNVRKSKPAPALYPRPKTCTRHYPAGPQIERSSRTVSLPLTSPNTRRTKGRTIELRTVYNSAEEFEILNLEESYEEHQTLSFDPGIDKRDVRYRSVDSIDSGVGFETPRLSMVERQHTPSQNNESRVFTKVVSEISVGPENHDEGEKGAIDIVCALTLPVSDSDGNQVEKEISKESVSTEPESPQQSKEEDTGTGGIEPRDSSHVQCIDEDDGCSTDEDIELSTPVRLVEPRSFSNKEKHEYAQQLRQKLSWKLAAERAIRKTLETVEESKAPCEQASSSVTPKSDLTGVEQDDPELSDFVSRTFSSALSIRGRICSKPENALVAAFVPTLLHIPDIISRGDCPLSPTASSADTLDWSDGEAWELSDNDTS